ncbi:DUF2341 domain-containing protein, partial [archaeon]|nr:DUF2341 domain-containing protein [archaeon]
MNIIYFMKKAVSPLISVMLVLVFTVSISTAILGWVTDYTKTTTQAVTETANGPKGITYCANSNVEISNVALRNQQIAANTSVSSGTVNYFDVASVSGTPTITFTGVSSGGSADGLAGWWHFDNDALDSSTNNNAGTLNGDATYNSSGKFSQAVQFDGDDNVTIADDSTLDITDTLTLSAWVNVDNDTDSTYTINGEQLTRRKLITINGSMVTTETNIPLMLRTKLPGVKAGGSDVRLSKLDGTPLPREIEWHYMATDDVVLHYPFNTTASTDSQFYVYWGNNALNEPAASSTYGSEAVWDGYSAVYHMSESPILDSTLNGNDATVVGGNPTLSDGDYGIKMVFDGNDYFDIPDADTLDFSTSDFDILMIVKSSVSGGDAHSALLAKLNTEIATQWSIQYLITTGFFNFRENAIARITGNVNMHDNTKHIIQFHRESGTFYWDVDNINKNSATMSISMTNTAVLSVGRRSSVYGEFTGDISEIRIIKSTISSNYRTTTHRNLNNPTTNGPDAFYLDVADDFVGYSAISDSLGNVSKFSRRKSITLNHSGALTDYQTKLNITYESEMLSNFDDIRFVTDSDAHIPYWIENKTDGVTADVWIKSNLTDGNTTIWMYYGNDGLSAGSDGGDVFLLFDDFEDGDVSDWTLETGVTFDASTAQVKEGTYSGRHTSSGDNQFAWKNLSTQYKGNLSITTDWYATYTTDRQNRFFVDEDSTNLVSVIPKATNTDILLNLVDVGEFSNSAWYSMQLTIIDDTTDTATLFWDDVELGTQNNNNNMIGGVTKIGIAQYFEAGTYHYIDNIQIRKYTSTEPTYTVGAEQSPTYTSIISKSGAYSLGANTTH